jgi:hypothetical protein
MVEPSGLDTQLDASTVWKPSKHSLFTILQKRSDELKPPPEPEHVAAPVSSFNLASFTGSPAVPARGASRRAVERMRGGTLLITYTLREDGSVASCESL